MAEIKNTFIKSKMNKDLDARLVPNGEYREAINASISTSEDSDVGALENIISNTPLLDEKILSNYRNLEIIGFCPDERGDRIFLFATSYSDGTIDQSGHVIGDREITDGAGRTRFVVGGACLIIYYDINTKASRIIVDGDFLNFSKTSPIMSADLIEDLLFWTDNRNQPRKINVETAIKDPSYYSSEDHISVAKFAPHAPISFLRNNVYTNTVSETALIDESSEYLPPSISTMFTSWDGNYAKIDSTVAVNDEYQAPYKWITGQKYIDDKNANSAGSGWLYDYNSTHGVNIAFLNFWRVYKVTNKNKDKDLYLRTIERISPAGNYYDKISFSDDDFIDAATPILPAEQTQFEPGDILEFSVPNPYYDPNFLNTNRDNSYLRDKFVRFSYRFKYDDNEYSLLAPFSQVAFIPKQQGRWLYDNDEEAKRSGIVAFMENAVTQVGLTIPTPESADGITNLNLDDVLAHHKIKEVQIVSKASNELSVKVIANLTTDDFLSLGSARAVELIEDGEGYANESSAQFTTLSGEGINGATGKYIKAVVNPSGDGQGDITAVMSTPAVYGTGIALGDEYKLRDPYNPTLSTTAVIKVTSLQPYIYYDYRSEKPIKTLPDNVLTRVADIIPMRALAQEAVGGRIIYGNFLQNLSTPKTLDFNVSVNEREINDQLDVNNPASRNESISIELPYHSLKQNRTYKVGIVLYDRFGRASNVITSSTDDGCFSGIINGSDSPAEWWGNAININFNEIIPERRTSSYIGLYNKVTNPLGWYSYRFVVQQLEQDWYNLYIPGTTSGLFKFDDTNNILAYEGENTSAMIAIYGDNINKLPRDLKEAGPQDKIYGSSKRLWNRLYSNVYTDNPKTQTWNQEKSPSAIEVSDIKPFRELGDWTNKRGIDITKLYAPQGQVGASGSSYPYPGATGKSDPFFRAQENPFIAILETKKRYGFHTAVPYSQTGWTAFTGGIQGGTNDEEPDYDTFKFSQKLNIYEVEPDTSSIDIYYETSSTGLIRDLNQEIQTSTQELINLDIDWWNFVYNENSVPGSIVTGDFTIIKDNGDYLNQEFSFIELIKVEKIGLGSNNNITGATGVDITTTPYPQVPGGPNNQPYPNVYKFSLILTSPGSTGVSPSYAIRYADASVAQDTENLDYFSSKSANEEHYIFTFKLTDEDGSSTIVEKTGQIDNAAGRILMQELPDTRIASPKWLANTQGDVFKPLGNSSITIFGNKNYDPDNLSFWTDSDGADFKRFYGDGSLGMGTDLGFFRYRCFNRYVNNIAGAVRTVSKYEVDDAFNSSYENGDEWKRATGRIFTTFTLNQPTYDPTTFTNQLPVIGADSLGVFENENGSQISVPKINITTLATNMTKRVQMQKDDDVDKMIMLLDDHVNGAYGTKVDNEGVAYQIRRWALNFGMHDISGDNKNKFRLIDDNGWEYNNYNEDSQGNPKPTSSQRPNFTSNANSLFKIIRKPRHEVFSYWLTGSDLDVKVRVNKPDGSATEDLAIFAADSAVKCWIQPKPAGAPGSQSGANVGYVYAQGQPYRWRRDTSGNTWKRVTTWDGRYELAPKVTYLVGIVQIPTATTNAGGKTWDDNIYFLKWTGGDFTASSSFGSGSNQDLGGKWDGPGNRIRLNKNVRSGKRGAARIFVEVEAYDAADFSDPNNIKPGSNSIKLDVAGNSNNYVRAAFVVYDKQSDGCPGSGDS